MDSALKAMGYMDEKGSLTAKGRDAAKEWKPSDIFIRPELAPDHCRRVPIARREIIDVTGIVHEAGKTSAEAQFKWRWALTPIGKQIELQNPKSKHLRDVKETSTGGAWLRLYDDGWRLEKVEFRQ